MAEEEIKTEVVETVEVEPIDKREGILDYIKGAFKSKEKETVTEEQEVEKTPVRETEVPSEFLEAAKSQGWTDADVTEFASKYTDEELRELLPTLLEEEEEEIDDTVEEQTEEEEVEKDEDLEKLISSIEGKVLDQLMSKLGQKFEVLEDFQAEQTSRQMATQFETANQIFDEASKDFPIFGEFEKMPRFPAGPRKGELVPTSPEFKARSEVYDEANYRLQSGRSKTIQAAMDDALAWYRGKHGQKETERKVVRNLKKQEQKLSGARTGKETKKEFESSRDEILDYIRNAQKASGQD
jgi:hypothetical protein